MAQTLSYRWRQSDAVKVADAAVASFEWEKGTLYQVRQHLADNVHKSSNDLASTYVPELWLQNEDDTVGERKPVVGLTWTADDASTFVPELFQFHDAYKTKPKAFILFTFPPADPWANLNLQQRQDLLRGEAERQVAKYVPHPLADIASFQLNAPVEPLVMLRPDLVRKQDAETRCDWWQPGVPYDEELSSAFEGILRNRKTAPQEDGLHQRDDFLLDIIVHLAGMRRVRNATTQSSYVGTRPDATLYPAGYPPLVFMEEKADETQIDEALDDLHTKFIRRQEYLRGLPYVFGIAVAGDKVSIVNIVAANHIERRADGEFDWTQKADAVRLFQAAINIGRFCQYVINNPTGLLSRLTVGLNDTIRNQHAEIVVTFLEVSKIFKRNVSDRRFIDLMTHFYTRVAPGIPHLEQAQVTVLHQNSVAPRLALSLQPVGVQRRPESVEELKQAILHIAAAVAGLHRAGWTHNDIRWPNIIFVDVAQHPRSWFVIDCEFAARIGELPIRVKQPNVLGLQPCTTAVDMQSIGDLFRHEPVPRLISNDQVARDLVERLELATITAAEIPAHAWFQ